METKAALVATVNNLLAKHSSSMFAYSSSIHAVAAFVELRCQAMLTARHAHVLVQNLHGGM